MLLTNNITKDDLIKYKDIRVEDLEWVEKYHYDSHSKKVEYIANGEGKYPPTAHQFLTPTQAVNRINHWINDKFKTAKVTTASTSTLKGMKTTPQYKYAIETRYDKPIRVWCNLHNNNYWYGADLDGKGKYVGGTLMEIPISYAELKKFGGNGLTFYKTFNAKIEKLNLPDGLKYF